MSGSICPSCSAAAAPGDTFCASCGQTLMRPAAPQPAAIRRAKPSIVFVVAVAVVLVAASAVAGYLMGARHEGQEAVAMSQADRSILSPTTSGATEARHFEITDEEVTAFLSGWKEAWQARNLQAFISHYSDEFVGRTYSKTEGYRTLTKFEWMDDKRAKFARADAFVVSIGLHRIYRSGDRAIVVFDQQYRAPGYRDAGEKTLYLQEIAGRLHIIREDFTPY